MRWIFFFRFQVGGTFHQVLYITVVHTNDHIKMIEILRTDRTGTMGQIVTATGSMHPHTAVGQFPSIITQIPAESTSISCSSPSFFMRVRITSSAEEDLQILPRQTKSILFIYNLQMEIFFK